VKVENVQKNLIVRFGRFLHIHPDGEAFICEQLGQLLDGETLFDLILSGAIDKNIHVNSPLIPQKNLHCASDLAGGFRRRESLPLARLVAPYELPATRRPTTRVDTIKSNQ
jgi:hypothetical protein